MDKNMNDDLKFSISFEVTGKNIEDFFEKRPNVSKQMSNIFYDEVYEEFERVYEELKKSATSCEKQDLYSSIKKLEINFLKNLKTNIFYFVLEEFILKGTPITNKNILNLICKEFVLQILETYKNIHLLHIKEQMDKYILN